MSEHFDRTLETDLNEWKSSKKISNIVLFKVEGKGNGIKTVIVNMVDVARALLRPPTYVTKYFGCELGAQTQFDIKVKKSDSTRQSFVGSIYLYILDAYSQRKQDAVF